MYINKCIKCGAEFETKNPKRVICPKCLYADKSSTTENSTDGNGESKPLQSYSSYSAGEERSYERPRYNNYNQGGYQQRQRQDFRRDNSYQQRRSYGDNNYRRDNNRSHDNVQGGFRKPYGNNRPNNRFQNNRFQNNRKQFNKPKKQQKPLLLSKEQLENIEVLYKTMLPLPNPDAHELIGNKLGIEPQKVFFGINLIRQKMMLPKLAFPKRKLAITPDQMTAIKSLYEPLLPLPPIGCHKIIAAQLRMDEWRVHVGIKLVRAQLGLERWNEDRADKPADCMIPKHPRPEKTKGESKDNAQPKEVDTIESADKEPVAVATEKTIATEVEPIQEVAEEVPAKPKRGRKPKIKNEE